MEDKCLKILFIDDEEINRILAEDLLESLGYNVKTSNSGTDGINVYKKNMNDIDLVILDFLMPGLNGKETFIELRKINPKCKIILVSGFSEHEDITIMRGLGLNGELTKPYRIEDLNKTIKLVFNV